MRIVNVNIFVLCLLIHFSVSDPVPAQSPSSSTIESSAPSEAMPFVMPEIRPPEIPARRFIITAFGAKGDGHTLNTAAFRQCIDVCVKSGGGQVVVPAGLWLTGPIEMQSRIDLHLDKGAVILFTPDRSQYPIIRAPSKGFVVTSPLYGFNLHDIALTGEGLLDGAGESWRPVKKFKTTDLQWKKLLKSGGVVDEKSAIWWPSQEAMDGADYIKKLTSTKKKKNLVAEDYLPARDFLRPYMISFIDCQHILIESVTIKNSPKFALCPAWCEEMIIKNVKVNNEWWAQNGDGIDISSCRNVLVEACTVTAGDDGICMKSSERSGRSKPALENIVVRDCVVYHGHGGFVIGSNTDGGMRNVFVENCTFIGTDVGLRFKSSRDRGGVVENIFIKNIFMKDIVDQAILFDLLYEAARTDSIVHPVTGATPIFRKIEIDSVYCIAATEAIHITGLPEMPVQQLAIRNSYFATEEGMSAEWASGIAVENVRLMAGYSPVFNLKQCWDFNLKAIEYPDSATVFLTVAGMKSQSIVIKNTAIRQKEMIHSVDGRIGIVTLEKEDHETK